MTYCNAGGHESTEGGLLALLLAVLVADDAWDGVGEGTVAGAGEDRDVAVAAIDSLVVLVLFAPIVSTISKSNQCFSSLLPVGGTLM